MLGERTLVKLSQGREMKKTTHETAVPECIKVELKTKCETQAAIEVDRTAGPYVHLRLNDGNPGNVDPFLYENFGDKIVLLTSEEARQIGQKMLDFADHIDKYPDLRKKRRKSDDN